MKEISADLVIVAAGVAGLAASVAAGERGVSVAVLEKVSEYTKKISN